ncbi:MAG: HAMP domain-containing sensor histidine kinase [Acidimicrobiia bacterium]
MRLLAVALGLAAGAVVAMEVAMRPTTGERLGFVSLFGSVALLGALAGWALRRRAKQLPSMRALVLVVPLVALGAVALTVSLSAALMFTSGHDLGVVLVALTLGVGLGAALSVSVTRPLASDLKAMADTARRLGAGDLRARTGVERADEIGDAANALDTMASRLGDAERQRAADYEARQHLLAAISHDLRTPLSALQAAIEALEDGVAADPQRYLRSMGRDVAALRNLVDDLFLLTRIESGDYTAERLQIDLAELADEAVEALSPVANTRGVALSVTACDGATVLGAPSDLGRAIRNLLDNAIRHAPSATTVRVEVSNGGPQATLRVIDEGTGFSPEFVATAFERFAKGDAARGRDSGGAGLGLAIARGVVEAHGGRIWIEPGQGGEVALRLPVSV